MINIHTAIDHGDDDFSLIFETEFGDRTLAGLLPPLAGSVALEGAPLASLSARERAQRLGIVLTERLQTGYLTGFELAAAGRYPHTGWQGKLGHEDVAIVDEALALVGAAAFRGNASWLRARSPSSRASCFSTR